MNRPITFATNYLHHRWISRRMKDYSGQPDPVGLYYRDKDYLPGKKLLSPEETAGEIARRIRSGEPFLAGRFGANELNAVMKINFGINRKLDQNLKYMRLCAGFYPATVSGLEKFTELMLASVPQADLMGVWNLPLEPYYLKNYGKGDLRITSLPALEPWMYPRDPWSAALKGKTVLLIHPLQETIERQYARREAIFPGTEILPRFRLKTLKSVMTIAGVPDERFPTWFDALEWMYQEAMKVDFDVAIIGCGAYGFPLAAKLKAAGKQAIHLGGATQILFGIKGRRWVEGEAFGYVRAFFNDAWVYPGEDDRPKNYQQVENGCYW